MIREYQHGEGDFWQLMGPFFASATIRRELGRPLSSDENYVWWISLDGGKVTGFGAIRQKRKVVEFCHAYVFPSCRGQGIYREIVRQRLEYCMEHGHDQIRAVVTAGSRPELEKQSFLCVRKRGRYSVMAWEKESIV